MTSYLETLLIDCMKAQGLDVATAERAAAVVVRVEVAAGVVSQSSLDLWERDARLYHLRGQGIGCTVLGTRFAMSRAQVFERIKSHAKRRRNALVSVA